MVGISKGKDKAQYDLEKIRDGVWVFRRDLTCKIWHYRITVNTTGRRYKVVSTKQENYKLACEMAVEAYFSARQLVKIHQGHTLFKKLFNDVIDEWFKAFDKDNTNSDNMRAMHKTATVALKKYFSEKTTNQINDELCENYQNWRLGTKTVQGTTPSGATLRAEIIALNLINEYASRKNYINPVQKVKPPKQIKLGVGDAFTDDELDIFFKHADEWILDSKADHKLKKQRTILISKFIMYSGIRLAEATLLKWEHTKFSNVHKTIFIDIPSSISKVKKERDVVCLPPMIVVLMELKKLSTDDFLFGEGFEGDYMFNRYLEFIKDKTGINLKYGNNNQRRVLYSFRHTYATKRILEGDVDAFVLSENMGTSVHQVQKTYYHGRNSMNAQKLLHTKEIVKQKNVTKIKLSGLEDIQMVNYRIDLEAENVPESDNIPS